MKEIKDERDFSMDDNQDLFNIFEDIIKPGSVEMEREVVKGFKIKLKVLDTGEAIAAESIMRYDSRVPVDLVARARGAAILSRAIVSINNDTIERDDMSQAQKNARRDLLFKQLLKLPALIIQKAYELYIEAYQKQQEIYDDLGNSIEEIKNF